MMRTGPLGVALIKEFEGLRLTAYQDEAGVWTIGYGHTRTAREGMVITMAQADALLRADLATSERAVNRLNVARIANGHPGLTQRQFDALVSFDFNTGGLHRRTRLFRAIEDGDNTAASAQFERWVFITQPGGVRVSSRGLRRRRVAERSLWESVV